MVRTVNNLFKKYDLPMRVKTGQSQIYGKVYRLYETLPNGKSTCIATSPGIGDLISSLSSPNPDINSKFQAVYREFTLIGR